MESLNFICLGFFLVATLLTCQARVLHDKESTTDSGCGGKPADVIFVLDASSSIWGPHFRKQLDFVHNLGQEFDISPSRTRVGVITFSDDSREEFGLNTYTDKSSLLSAIDRTVQTRGDTMTDGALLRMRDTFTREARDGVPRVAIVMTDGESDFPEATRQEARLAHKADITVFAIGIGRRVVQSELESIASRKSYVFTVDTFDALESIRDLLALRACAVQHIPEDAASHHDEEEEEEEKTDSDFPVVIQATPRGPIIQYQEEGHFEGGILVIDDNQHYDQRPGEGDGWNTEELLAKGCESKPADVVFALDASGSIWGKDFKRQLNFIQDLVGAFHIHPLLTRIGVLTFGDVPTPQFHMDKYKTEGDVKQAISKITQSRGTTNTADAILTMANDFFSKEHARDGVVRIGIVVTDGKSDDSENTALAAKMARETGINLFAIGVGKEVVHSELESIASEPAEQFVWTVNNYGALSSIKDLLAVKACEVTAPPTTTPLPTTTEPMQADYSCGSRRPADVVFAMPSSADREGTNHALDFFQQVSSEFSHLEDGGVNIGLVPKECQSVDGFHLKNTGTKDAILERFRARHHFQPDNAQTIKYLRGTAFKKVNGARVGANRIAVMIVDRNSRNLADTATESFKARAKKDIDLFTVVVGKHVSEEEVKALTGGSTHGRVLRVNRYDQLNSLVQELTSNIHDTCH